MFAQDKEIIIAVVTSTCLMVFLVGIIVTAIIKYQNKNRKHFQEMHNLKLLYQEEIIKAQIEKEEQTLTRISQEIHDNIGQILSLVKLNLNTLEMEGCDPLIKNKVLGTKDLVGKAINDLRQLSKSLNSIHLSQGYLSEALSLEVEIIKKTGIYNAEFTTQGEERHFDPQKQLIIFRIAQEALNNIIKHAHAHNISVVLNYLPEFLNLTVVDDGDGFTILPKNSMNTLNGTGIGNLYHRAKLLGASIDIESAKGKGTSIILTVPIG
jgi:two-component system, NarL family, sensor kinase